MKAIVMLEFPDEQIYEDVMFTIHDLMPHLVTWREIAKVVEDEE